MQIRIEVILPVAAALLLIQPLAALQDDVPVTEPIQDESPVERPSGETPEVRARAMVEHWETALTELEKALAHQGAATRGEDDTQTLMRQTFKLQQEMSFHVATGHEELLARAMRLASLLGSGIENAQRGMSQHPAELSIPGMYRPEAAIGLARQLWPAITSDLDRFGTIGVELLNAIEEADRVAAKLKERAQKMQESKGYVPPSLRGSLSFDYPPPAKAAGVEAVVRIRYLIDENGIPTHAEVLDRDVPSSLLLAAIEGVLSARFEPAMVGNRAVPALDTVSVRFQEE